MSRGSIVYQSLRDHAEQEQKEIRQFLDARNITYRWFCIVNAIAIWVEPTVLSELRQFPQIRQMTMDAPIRQPFLISDKEVRSPVRTFREMPWGLQLMNVDAVWEMGYRGQGVTVGGHDTGVDWSHPALVHRYRGMVGDQADHNFNWHDAIHDISPLHQDSMITEATNPCGLDLLEPCDDAGSSHGTHTMGTMVGHDIENGMQVGVAPEAEWIAVRNMERGFGSLMSYLEGFEWFLAPTDLMGQNPNPELAPDVINNSWACIELEGCQSNNFDILETAVNNLRTAGIVVVASAGNGGAKGCATINNPSAIFEGAFTVGSVDQNDSLSSFSSRGPVTVNGTVLIKPNVTAPGRGVLSSIKGSNGYGMLTGTSMAGPHVAGLVALILSANPSLKGQVEKIEEIIETTAVRKFERDSCSAMVNNNQTPNALHGFGRVDALAAVESALDVPTSVHQVENAIKLELFPNPSQNRALFEAKQSCKECHYCGF